jgi:single-strand DNA-binding protein
LNSVQLIGRLTADPKAEKTTVGTSVAKLRIAVDRRPAAGGEDRGSVFVDVTAYGRLGEVVAEHCGRGRQVAVTARLEMDEWVADDGTNRSRHYLVADSVDFLARPNGNGAPPTE